MLKALKKLFDESSDEDHIHFDTRHLHVAMTCPTTSILRTP